MGRLAQAPVVCPRTGWGPSGPSLAGQGSVPAWLLLGSWVPVLGYTSSPVRPLCPPRGVICPVVCPWGNAVPSPHPPLRVCCVGRGWRDISWTVRDPRGEGRGVAAAAQSLPPQVSAWGKRREGRTETWGSLAKRLTILTCSGTGWQSLGWSYYWAAASVVEHGQPLWWVVCLDYK